MLGLAVQVVGISKLITAALEVCSSVDTMLGP